MKYFKRNTVRANTKLRELWKEVTTLGLLFTIVLLFIASDPGWRGKREDETR